MDSIKALANWGYFVSSSHEDEIMHEFGWRDGFNFYLTDFGAGSEPYRFVLSVYKDGSLVSTMCFKTEFQVAEYANNTLKNQ